MAEEHPCSFPDQTAIDLIFEHPGRAGHRFVLVTECKRAYTENKRWVFFRERVEEINAAHLVHCGKIETVKIPPFKFGLEPFSEGIEIDLGRIRKQPDAAFKSGSCDRIHAAASQVCKGLLGFTLQSAWENVTEEGSRFLIAPVIVTNAGLYSCENDYDDICIGSGNLETELDLKQQPWVVLRHPYSEVITSGFTDFRRSDRSRFSIEERGLLFKESIYVVSVVHLKEFLDGCGLFELSLPVE